MPSIGPRCHELRVGDADVTWRIFYRIDPDAIVILEVLKKKTPKTPKAVLEACRRRLAEYDRLRRLPISSSGSSSAMRSANIERRSD